MKKLLLLLVSLTLCTCMTVSAQRAVKLDGVVYSIENSGSGSTGYATAVRATDDVVNLIIPDEVEFEGEKYPVTTIEKQAFKDVISLKRVQFGKGVNYIGEEAFYNCQGLESVVIPESVATLGNKAFGKCTGLSEVIIEEGSSPLEALLSENEKSAEPFSGCIINHLYLNRMIKNIGLKYAGIKHLKVGDIYTSIPDEMFLKVKSLKSVNFEGQSLVRIGKDAFSGCDSLLEINLPKSLKTIENGAFSYCDSLKLSLPASLEVIGESAFIGCGIRNTIRLDREVLNSLGASAFRGCKVDTVVFSGGWETVPAGLFSGSTLSYLELDDNVVRIGGSAFSGCTQLKNLTLPNSIKYIDDFAFWGCYPSSFTVSESVSSLGFGNCRGEEMIIEDSDEPLTIVVGLEESVTYAVPSHSVHPLMYFTTCRHDGWPQIERLYIGRALKFLCKREQGLFHECLHKQTSPFQDSNVREVTMASLDSIPTNMFYNCEWLKEVKIIPNGHEYSVCDNAFRSCKRFRTIEFPEGLISIGSNVFKDAYMKDMTLHNVTPPATEIDSFDDEIYSKVTLYVPAESVELYQTTMPWIMFNKIVGVDFAEIDEIATDATDEEAPVEYFNLSGVKVNGDNLSKGIYLRRQGSTVTKIAVK